MSPAQNYAPVPAGNGPTGNIRSTGTCMLLFVVTLGIYGLVWWFKVHSEMQSHRGTGLGGGVALVIAIFVAPVAAYLTANEVGDLYRSRGQEPPVSAATGLWYIPGNFILVGPFVWFVKVNGALNDYWATQGAQR